jgi:hypothetical protein
MDRKTWIITLILLAAFVLAVDFFFIHVLFPIKKKAFMDRIFQSPPELGSSLPLPDGLRASYEAPPHGGDQNFSKTVSECFSDSNLAASANPKELFERLEKKYQIKKRMIQSEQINYTNSNNEPMKLAAFPEGPEGNQVIVVHLYKMEKDLPSPAPIDPVKARNPTKEFLSDVIGNSTVTYHQLKETVLLGNENVAKIEWVNDDIVDFQTVADKKTFTCSGLTCTCN